MKKLIYIFLIGLGLLCATKSFAQTINTNKFDIERFESKKTYNKTSLLQVNDTLKDGTTIMQYDADNVYVEQIQKLNSPFILYNNYYKKIGKLKSTSKEFSGCTIGFSDEYNENGKLVKQINFDQNYSFSIYDLAIKLKKEFNINIMQSSQNWTVYRKSFGDPSYYQVIIGPVCKCNMRVVMIDGKTGKTISDSIVPFQGSATD